MFFGAILHDYLEGPWEQARGYLREELEQLRAALNSQVGNAFTSSSGASTLNASAIGGDPTVVPQYVSNIGVNNAPTWDKVDLASGVKRKLALTSIVDATPDVLLGRGAGTGSFEEISLGTNLAIVGTTLNAAVGDVSTTGSPSSGELAKFSGAASITNGDLSGDVTTAGSLVTTLKLAARTRTIEVVIDGGGAPVPVGIVADRYIPYAGTIKSVTLLADQVGSVIVDIWSVPYASYPAAGGNSITGSSLPTITTGVKSQDTTLSGWTTALAIGDCLRFNVNSVTSITRVTLTLEVTV